MKVKKLTVAVKFTVSTKKNYYQVEKLTPSGYELRILGSQPQLTVAR